MDFETTFEELFPAVFRYCHRLTGDPDLADDVAQEAFFRLFRGRVEGPTDSLRVWLFRTATHLVRDRYRVETNRERLLETHPVQPASPEPPDREAERAEAVAHVRAVLDDLESRDREMLLMKQEGFSYREIAETVGVAPGSVGTLLARAERKFAQAYEASGGVR